MRKEASVKDWLRMYKELTDKETQAKIRQKAKVEARKKERISDTGL